MIKIENIETYGWEAAIRGMRNPLNSWAKSDSGWRQVVECGCRYRLGKNDLELAKKLAKAGPEHAKYLRMINVSMDITAPLYWWSEYDTYKVGTVANSCSKMHTLHKREITLDDFSHEHLFKDPIDPDAGENILLSVIDVLNFHRSQFIKSKDKEHWWQMIQLLPSSYNQKRTVMLNYQTIANICKQRKGHKLDEWNVFVETMLKELPYSELLKEG